MSARARLDFSRYGSAVIRSLWEFPVGIPRHAFSVRDAARAADVWRAYQEVAVEASTRGGWSPARYRDEGVAFVMRHMTVSHEREPSYGEELVGRTWVRRLRREMFSTREVRLVDAEGAIVSAGTQEWVHVNAELAPTRAPAALIDAFPLLESDDTVELPPYEERQGPPFEFSFDAWFTWMDPLDHVNHPGYLDFCDEAISRRMAALHLSPLTLRPVAERITFRAGVRALDATMVRSHLAGVTELGDAVFVHRITVGETRCADAVTVRRTTEGAGPLVEAFSGAEP